MKTGETDFRDGGETPFLLNFTDGQTRSLVDRFDLHHAHDIDVDRIPGLFLPPFMENGTLYGLDETEDNAKVSRVHDHNSGQTDEGHTWKRCSRSRLEQLALALKSCRNDYGIASGANAETRLDVDDCKLFEPDLANRLIEAYFVKWHPHAPMLHRPTFQPDKATLPLLASIILMGAMFYAQHTAFIATDWLDLVETFVFEHPEFRRVCEGTGLAESQVTFELLQASGIVVIMQDWGHDLISRRRMRLHRYIDVIAVARSMNIFSLVHEDLGAMDAFDNAQWLRFIAIEERIRTAAYIYLIDCAWMLFHGTSPRMTTHEMSGHGPSLEAVFEAETAELCAEVLFFRPIDHSVSLASAISMLLDDSADNVSFLFTTLNLFMLIHAIHVALFSSKATCTLQLTRTGLELALRRWKTLWDLSITTILNEDHALAGFYRAAPEYCHMGHIMLRAYSAARSNAGSAALDTDTMAPINDLLKHFSDLGID